MKKIKILIVVFTINSLLSSGQSIKFGDIQKTLLEESESKIEESANAEYLYKYRKTYYLSSPFQIMTEIQERVKIFNSEGFDKATVEIDLFKSGSTRESVKKIKAVTYNLENGKIAEYKLNKKDIFKGEYNDNFNQVKFTMPNVKEGSIIEYSYTIVSPFVASIDEFEFQDDIPIRKLEASFSAPIQIVFKPNYKGYILSFPKRERRNSAGLGGTVNIEKYDLSNVPALKDETHVDNLDNYKSAVKYEIKSIDINGYMKNYSQTWKDVAQTIGNTDDYEKKLDKTKPFRIKVDELIKESNDDKDKMKLIFQYVKENIKWNGYYNKYFQKGIKEALEQKKGNSADINLTLVSMLRYAGLKSDPLIICTKDNGIPMFPTLDKLNSVIAYVNINDENYFLDATDEFSNINLLPINSINWQGVLIDNNEMSYKLVNIPAPKMAVKQQSLNYTIDNNGDITGKYSSKISNHFAYDFRKYFKNKDVNSYLTELENKNLGIEISNHEIKNTDSSDDYVTESYDFYLDEVVDVSSDKIIINPMYFLALDENPFKSDERKYPIDFRYSTRKMTICNITIPEGFKLEAENKPIIMKLPDNKGSLRYTVQQMGNKLAVNSMVEIKYSKYQSSDYGILKEFFNQIVKHQTEPLILIK